MSRTFNIGVVGATGQVGVAMRQILAERDFPVLGPDGEETTIKANDTAPYSAFVWKTIADPFAGRITMLRVVTGTLKSASRSAAMIARAAINFRPIM